MKKEEKARVRVFFGEIEGDNETIRDGLRSIAQAVNKTFQQEARVVRVITAGDGSGQLTDELEQQIIEAEFEANEETINGSEGEISGNKTKSKNKTTKRPKNYAFVGDLNLYPDGEKSFREFYQEKRPKDNQELLTATVYYLQNFAKVGQIGNDHLYTALKDLKDDGVAMPVSIESILKNIVQRKGWISMSEASGVQMTVPGDNFIEQTLSKRKPSE